MVTITPEAKGVVQDALAAEQDPSLALWLEVSGVEGAAYAYDVYFKALRHAGPEDVITHDEQLAVVVPAGSVRPLTGARLEWSEESQGGGLVLVNPNRPAPEELAPGVPPEVLANGVDGALARRVIAVLESSVNPSIASHGGRADLVGLDEQERKAYVRLSGGCQGCAMSRMTLTQGIEATLRDEIAELAGVIDVTDHGSGENPFF